MALKITFEAQTDVGLERSDNQDHYGASRQENVDFFVVCDGMGGHAGGSTASRLAVQAIEDTLEDDSGDVPARMEAAILVANDAIHSMAAERRELRGMGTTAVMLGIDYNAAQAYVSHVGDSRAYRLRGTEFERLTRDHTMVQRLVDEGIISEDEAENHPQSNVISRSLGGHPVVEVEHGPNEIDLQDGDIFLLCSDGLCGLVSEPDMAATLANLPPDEATERLIEQANDAGGHDNITAEVILLGTQPAPFDPAALQLIHPPKGAAAAERFARIEQAERERLEREDARQEAHRAALAADAAAKKEAAAREQATEDTPSASSGAPVLEDQSTGRLLFILGGLILLLVFLVVGLILKTSAQDEDVVVPSNQDVEQADDDPVRFRDAEDAEPQPVYDVTDESGGEDAARDAADAPSEDDASDAATKPTSGTKNAPEDDTSKKNPFDEDADASGKSPVLKMPVDRSNPFGTGGEDDAPARPSDKGTADDGAADDVAPAPAEDTAPTPEKPPADDSAADDSAAGDRAAPAKSPADSADDAQAPTEEKTPDPPRAKNNPF